MSLIAPISNISRGSLHDGPGVRTVVYFKGCPLRCRWCHNPETFSAKKQLAFLPHKCICCGRCITVCPECHMVEDGKLRLLRENCISCGKCADSCPNGALELIGNARGVDELIEELKKDEHYYKTSGGGVTFSGGECLLYPDFVASVAERLCAEGIHTAVESALFVRFENIERVMPHIKLFFCDLKIADPKKHAEYTGQDNRLILENLRRLSECAEGLVVRIPVIPGVNDSPEDLAQAAEIIAGLGPRLAYVELLKYNNLAESKYSIIGREYTSFATEPQSDERMRELCKTLSSLCGKKCVF